jgi:DNA invertase Pin-like site-specific DNA recombinase
MRVGYARVSGIDQHPEAQIHALEAAGCEVVFTDHGVSGKLARRPELDAALRHLRTGDALVITRLDRLGRSSLHLLEIGQQLEQRGVALVATEQSIDTGTAIGKMFYTILAAVAEFERDLLIERTREGLATARKQGRTGGRKPKMGPGQAEHARKLYDQRDADGKPVYTVTDLAAKFGVSRSTVYNYLSITDTADRTTASI